MIKVFLLLFVPVTLLFSHCEGNEVQKTVPPNILFIVIDDLNDWLGCMNGHPQAFTPNIDRLAAMGILFTNAHAQCAICNPSRASFMTSLHPHSTGIYFNSGNIEDSPIAKENILLTQRFENEGYFVAGAGKLFHDNDEKYMSIYGGNFGKFGPFPDQKLSSFSGNRLWDWGVFPETDSLMPDYMVAQWGIEMLKEKFEKPFFIGLGFVSPHVPLYAPQKWFDLFPLKDVQLPEIKRDDLNDISPYASKLTKSQFHLEPTQQWILQQNQWEKLVQAYLATISFVDQQVGSVLEALEKSSYSENTYIILFSDHGFHLGEKERWGKQTLWEESTRVPLMISGPGIKPNQISNKPVQLLDIYPTLLELTSLDEDPNLEGHSLVPLLNSQTTEWRHPALSSFGPGNYSVRSERYRHIRYNDGTEEFYDHNTDPNEWSNLIKSEEIKSQVIKYSEFLPENFHPIIGNNSTGHKSYFELEALKHTKNN